MIEKRRHVRAPISRPLAEVVPAMDAQVVWSNHEISDVLDVSFKGLAVRRPGALALAPQHHLPIQIRMVGTEFNVQARVAWVGPDAAGFEFVEVPPEGQLALAEGIDAKLLADAAQPVERKFFAQGASFHQWFQCPRDHHIYVWHDEKGKIAKVEVECDGEISRFHRGPLPIPLDPTSIRALRLVSHMDNSELKEFVRELAAGVSTGLP